MRKTTRLKQLIAAPEIVVLPGVHDALGARLAPAAGLAALLAGADRCSTRRRRRSPK